MGLTRPLVLHLQDVENDGDEEFPNGNDAGHVDDSVDEMLMAHSSQ